MSYSNILVQTLADEQKLEIPLNYLSALRIRDWSLLRSIITEDCVGTLPANSFISGEASRADAVIKRAKTMVSFEVSLQLNQVLYGRNEIALYIHNQANRNELYLNEFLVTVCLLKDGKIAGINSHFSDASGVNAFLPRKTNI